MCISSERRILTPVVSDSRRVCGLGLPQPPRPLPLCGWMPGILPGASWPEACHRRPLRVALPGGHCEALRTPCPLRVAQAVVLGEDSPRARLRPRGLLAVLFRVRDRFCVHQLESEERSLLSAPLLTRLGGSVFVDVGMYVLQYVYDVVARVVPNLAIPRPPNASPSHLERFICWPHETLRARLVLSPLRPQSPPRLQGAGPVCWCGM